MRIPNGLAPDLRKYLETVNDQILRLETLNEACRKRIASLESAVKSPKPQSLWVEGYAAAADYTIGVDQLGYVHVVDVTGSINVTLPDAGQAFYLVYVNVGSGTATIKDSGGSTVGTAGSGGMSTLSSTSTSAVVEV